jgi:hypothetical protein
MTVFIFQLYSNMVLNFQESKVLLRAKKVGHQRTVVDQNKMGQSKFRLCNSIFLGNPSLRKQKCQKLKKKSVGIYFSLFIGINLRIRRFNLQS